MDKLLPKLYELPGIISSGKDIVTEWKDRDDAEKDELKKYLKDNFDLTDDELEEAIEKSGNWIMDTTDLAGMWLKIVNRKSGTQATDAQSGTQG